MRLYKISVLLVVMTKLEIPQMSITETLLNKLCYIHTVEYYILCSYYI